jgi:hypothetical protein
MKINDGRLKAYLAILAAWGVLSGISYFQSAERLEKSPAFSVVYAIMPIEMLGFILFMLGLAAAAVLIFPGERWIRVFLTMSVFIKMMFGLAFAFSSSGSPGAWSLIAMAGFDMVWVSRQYHKVRVS